MRHPGWKRWVAALLGALFLGAGAANIYGFHQCSHHDEMDHGAGSSHAAMDGAQASVLSVEGSAGSDEAGDHGSHGPCTCVGTCHAGAASPVPSLGTTALTPGGTHHVVASGLPERAPRPPLSDYLLPFANAPPLFYLAA